MLGRGKELLGCFPEPECPVTDCHKLLLSALGCTEVHEIALPIRIAAHMKVEPSTHR